MEITIIGWLVIALTIYGFFKSEDFLLYLGIFFSTFTATSIINIDKTVTGIAPFYFIISFWILKVIINYIRSKKYFNKEIIANIMKKNKLIKSLAIFGVIIIIGELYMFISGKTIIVNNQLNNEVLKLTFSGSNITQPIYLLFMLVFAIFLSLKINSKEKIRNVLKIFFISTIFALIWGVMQFCMFYLGIEYPAYLFNNNIALAQLHFQMVYGIKRVNSIALEPSTFALNVLGILPIIMILWLSNLKIFKNNLKSNLIFVLIILLTLICGILTTSSTAYIGIALTILFITIYVLIFSIKDNALRKNRKRLLLFYVIVIISTILVIILAVNIFNIYWGTLVDMIKDMTINKINLESGHERSNAVNMSFTIFRQSPLVGIGWGSFRSLDTFTNLLANTGLLGVISYFYIIFITLKSAFLNRRKNEVISIALILSVVIMTISLLISIPDLVFGYYWMMIALTYNYCTNSKEGDNNENSN